MMSEFHCMFLTITLSIGNGLPSGRRLLETSTAMGNYIVTDTSLSWHEGNEYCFEQYGTSLATIVDDGDAQTLLDLTDTGVNAWVGLNQHSGDWEWASGYACDNGDCGSLPYWISGQPSGTGNAQHCAWVGWGSKLDVHMLMDDTGCSGSMRVVCDIPTSKYAVIDKLMSWSDANDYCHEEFGTSLATITNDADAQMLLDSDVNAWVGLSKLSGFWEWASGYACENGECSTLPYWAYGGSNPHQNPNGGRNSCSWLGWKHATGIHDLLDDTKCTKLKNFVCELPVAPIGISTAWNAVSNILVTSELSPIYVVTDHSMNWADGNAYCSDEYGSSLATITNDEEAQLLLDLTDTGVDAWIGLNKLDGDWAWASGVACDDGDCSTLPYWISGQPSNRGNEKCAWIGWGPHLKIHGLADDIGCTDIMRVVCDYRRTGDHVQVNP